jgi:hypothetical protein
VLLVVVHQVEQVHNLIQVMVDQEVLVQEAVADVTKVVALVEIIL